MQFKELKADQKFYDLNSGEYFLKVCQNCAEWLPNSHHQSGQLVTFDEDEFVDLVLEK